ncbi:MAG: hypothetical protein CRU78_16770, partial [Candidatus Accumulibacter phosphatis]|nr:hypothetical protein [Candidatus Accumulibacter phosphatis]
VINSLGVEGDTTTAPATPTLQGMAATANLSGKYALGTNIDAAATSVWNLGGGFAPIGSGGTAFNGTFEGLGHTVSNLTTNLPGADYVGLFGNAGTPSAIRNLGLVGGSVSGRNAVGGLVGWNSGNISTSYATNNVGGAYYVGGLVGYNTGAISNAYATGTVSGSGPYVGGLVGWNNPSATLSNVYATGAVSGSGNNVGGLVGFNSYGTISDAYATGTVSGSYAGGLVGLNDHGTISNAHATGNVGGSSSDYVGGLVGYDYYSSVSDSYATGTVTGSGTNLGGLLGYTVGSTVTNSHFDVDQSTVNGQSKFALYGLYHDQLQDWASHGMSLAIADYGASLPYDSVSGSYGIGNVQGLKDLQGFAEASGVQFRLTADLDLASLPGYYLPNFSAASLDGAGHSLANLTLNLPAVSGVGFISNLASGSTVSNLSLTNVSVSGGSFVGGLAGTNNGTLSNVDSSGVVTGSGPYVGGLVGWNYGTINGNSNSSATVSSSSSHVGGLVGVSSGPITDAYATGTVSGSGAYVGGLVGWNSYATSSNVYATGSVSGNGNVVGGLMGYNDHGTIDNAYATGTVSGYQAGGLVGINDHGTISNSHATGNVGGSSSSEYVGGLVGNNLGTISNSYARGVVSGAHYVGGLLGNNDGSVNNSHYDIDQSTINGQSLVTPYGLYHAQFQDWQSHGQMLAIADYGSSLPFDGTSYGVGSIQGLKDLLAFSELSGAQFRLTSDLDLASLPGYYLPAFSAASLDGAEHSITNLNVNLPFNNVVGFIGSLPGGSTVTNVRLVNISVNGYDSVGGLVGINAGTIGNADSSGTVSGASNVGGLAGANSGSINNASSSGTVTGVNYVGGLLGSNSSGTIRDGYATGSVTGNSAVGGLVGWNGGGPWYSVSSITNSYATGNVSGDTKVGGLVGWNGGGLPFRNSPIANSYATGAVVGTGIYIGGLVGYNGQADDHGYFNGTPISNSYAIGPVSGSDQTGGLVGANSGVITNSYAAGRVNSGGSSVGGLVGQNSIGRYLGPWVINHYPGTIANSFWDAASTGQTIGNVGGNGGGIGMSTAQMQQQTNFTSATSANGNVNPAWDFADTWVMYDGHTYPMLGVFMTPLTVTASSVTKTYDGLSYSGGNGVSYSTPPNLAYLSGFVSYSGNSQGATNAGSYVITPSGLSALYSNQHGYNITYADGALIIDPATLTVTADPVGKNYGQANPLLSGSVTGFVGGDTLASATTGTASFSTPATSASNVGSYAVTGSGLSANFGNYLFAQAPDNATALTISPATLTVTADSVGRIYGQANPLLSGSITGFVSGDTLASATTGTASFSTPATSASNVGSYAITGSGLSANFGNYLFAQAPDNAAALTISPATLTVTADSVSRIYGAANPLLSGSVTGFVGSDTLASATTGTASFSTPATSASNVGSYAVTGSGLSANFGNYLFAQAPDNATALTINPATLTVTADAVGRIYGQANPLLSGSITGFVSGDTLASATTGTASFSTPATSASNVGSYAVTGSGLSANFGNYLFEQAPANATALTINPATLTVIADSVGRTYGAANPLLSGSVIGFVGSDTLASATAGTETFSTPATSTNNVGSYAVVGSGLSANFGNYLFAQAPANATALTINPATLTVTADSVSRIYGTANPPLSGSITGFVGSDTPASATTGTATYSTPATSSSNVGSYAVTGSGLSANFGNYLFAQAPDNATALTIDPATLTVAADSVSRIYGAANPLLSGSITGFVGSDTLDSATTGTETFSTPATGTSNVGSYAVTGSGLSANFGNYLFEQAPSNATALTINPATLTVIADSVGRTYGAANPLLSGSVIGFVASDTLASATAGTETFSTPATSASNIGSYAVVGSGLSANFGNYLFAQAPSNATALTISPATLTVSADSVSRIYGTANPLLSGSVTGFVGSDTLASATSGTEIFSTPATSFSNVGSYAVTGSGLSANFGNYLFAQAPANATALTINPATLTYAATPASFTSWQTPSGLSGTVNGFVAGDGLASSTAGTLAWLTPAGSSSPPGHYAINGSGLTAANYVFAQAAGNATALTLNPAPPPPEPATNPSSANVANSTNARAATSAANTENVPPPTPAASNL